MFTVQRWCYTLVGLFSEIVEKWIVPDFPCRVSSFVHVPPDTTIGILKNGVLFCRHTCESEHSNRTVRRRGGRTAPDTTTRCCTISCTRS